MSTDEEVRLRDALTGLADTVRPAPDAFQLVEARWRWRELRRRVVLSAVVILMVAAVTLAGLWALSRGGQGI
ncbi:hypothetical protein ACFOSC_12930 [Streptantibioticus rubrisoli]|uniref:DUF3040 domain-containing protein n=1 Tax=Streptantibioticus rubrisoli TaxID=1387313 RepID=A0ABT1P7W5_9ACTN|nr:hypothetical protein [Streptantibioticus rubrisoli]MCQ4041466.1 hypothetical protein [Streptantibioticus rubrisoli]